MKQIIQELLLSAGIVLLLSAPSFAFRDEPDNFRGIRWGTSIRDQSDMVLSEMRGSNTKYYLRNRDNMKMGQAEIAKISYLFYKDQFCGVTIIAEGYGSYESLKKLMVQAYGGEYQLDSVRGTYRWQGKAVPVLISLAYDKTRKKGVASYSYEPIGKEVSREEISKLLFMYLLMDSKCARGK